MGLYGGIKGAKYSEGGVYLKEGVFALEIQSVKSIKTRQGRNAFVAEYKVLESSNTECQKGTLPSWMVMLDQEPALGNIKQFLEAVMHVQGLKFDNLDEAQSEGVVEEVVSEKNPLKGFKVRASAVNIKTKKGANFTKVKYIPYDTSAAEIEKAHAANT